MPEGKAAATTILRRSCKLDGVNELETDRSRQSNAAKEGRREPERVITDSILLNKWSPNWGLANGDSYSTATKPK